MKLLLKTFTALLLGVVFAYFSADFLLELWWFRSLKLGTFFVLREIYAGLVSVSTTVVLTVVVFLNLFTIPRALAFQSDYKSKGLLGLLQGHTKLLWVFSLLVAVLVLIPVYTHWESFLLYFYAASSELTDPVYGRDISFYLFSYSLYALIQKDLLWFFALIFGLVSFLYFLSYKSQKDKQQEFPIAAKLHIATLMLILVLLQAWSIALERIDMLYEDRHMPVFYGPGFVEMNYHLPLIWLSFLLFLGTAITTVYSLYTGNKRKLAMGFGLAYLVILGIKQVDFIPNMIDDYYVGPNPVAAEAKNIQQHIKATSDAFNFADITEIDYELKSSLTPLSSREIKRELNNVPLWDDKLILPVFEQLQSIRPYFSFYQVAVDRYELGGENVQVNTAARELDYQSLPAEAKNWRNRHLVYTHGYGMVMTPSSQIANQPMQWLLQNFGQTSEFDKLLIEQPKIYYGLADYLYAIVPNTESLKPGNNTSGDMSSDYQGSGGLPLASLFTKAVVSAFLKDERIFFSAGINKQSRVLVRRNIFKRVKAIAPFLILDNEPYPILVEHKIYWVMDAYTASDRYPLVEPINLTKIAKQNEKSNYIRNSVKIIVDAYNGSVDFYVVANDDPIINTYQRIYPGLFKQMAAMPKPFIKHLSYPKAWFTLQMQLYARFHQTNPEIFYQQSEALELARMDEKPVEPYFLTLDIDEHPSAPPEDRKKFVLVSPLSPKGRENLDSIAIAGCLTAIHCKEHYQDDIYIYKFSKDIQVEGPAQISALMNQNPDISKQFTLWNQRGSKIIRGRMVIVPVEHSMLYIQPLYLEADSENGFPALAKVIVAMNRHSVMADSLALAFTQLQQKMLTTIEGVPEVQSISEDDLGTP
ncbi:MAG: UPF0182 family protein [Methyloprofundus sp.]|nr:UPF0182 family protein [Methyloprofundus sp.]